MNTFQYYIYSSYAKKEKSALEKAFEDLIKKVELYGKQYEITLKLYKSEWKKELKDLNDNYKINQAKGKEVYDKAYSEMEREDEQMRHSYADHVSGLDMLYYEHQEEKDNIKRMYLDFFDLFKQEKKILKKGLGFWFGILDKKILIKNVELEKVGKGKRNIEFDLSSIKRSIPKFKCKVSISRANKNSLEILDQTNVKLINEFNKLVDNVKSFIFSYVFELFDQSSKGIKIKVMMFEK